MKTGLYQGTQLKQEMKINPRLYQAMDLLYMPLLDLQQHLKQELLNNPFLEMGEDAEVEETVEQEKEKEKEVDEEEVGAEVVSLFDDRDAGVNIRLAGEDLRRGDLVLRDGTPLGPAELGVLASMAVAHPLVYRRPRVAILGGGDEIVDIDQPEEILSGRKVASSNSHTLVALVCRAGGEPVNLGIARDTPESVRAHLARGLDCDLIVTTAGISVGEHDHLRTVLAAMVVEQKFWKLRMRPGAPVGNGDEARIVNWVRLPQRVAFGR